MTTGGGRPQDEKVDDLVPTRVVVGRRSWAVPAIGVVALAIVLVGFLGQKPVVPPRPLPTVTESPSPTPEPVGIAWTEIPLDATAFQRARIGLVISGPKGVLAFGQDGFDRHPITWTSPDGRAWTRHDQPLRAFGGGVPDAAVPGGPGFIALGYRPSADTTTREIWTSPDGATWTRTPSPTGRDITEVTALAGSGGTAVLIGGVGGRQVLLSSRDGQVWAETPDLDSTLGQGPFIYSATQSGSGFLAVGALGSDENRVWRSGDGRDWAPVAPADPGVLVGAHLYRVFRTHAGFLATGYSDDPFGGGESAWVSPDAVTWTVGPTATDFGSRGVQALFAFRDGDLSASGDGRTFGGGVNWVLRASVDLGSWFTVESPMGGPLDWTRQATTVDDRLVALGWDAQRGAVVGWSGRLTRGALAAGGAPSPSSGSSSPPAGTSSTPTPTATTPPILPDPTTPLTWQRLESRDVFEDPLADMSLSGVVQFGSDVIGFGSAGPSGGLWRSTDANHWTRLPVPPSMRGARVAAATRFRDHLVAIGAITNADGTATPAVWTSGDGASWTRARGAPDWFNLELTDIVAGPDGLVAVGRRQGDQGYQAAVWTSRNGSAWALVPPISDFPFDPGMNEIRAIAYGEGHFVAVGRGQDAGPVAVGAVWVSSDGSTWTKVASGSVFGQSDILRGGREPGLNDIVAAGPGFVAVGSALGPTGYVVGAIFTSRDGISWTRIRGDDLLEASEPTTVTTWSGGLAVGATIRGNGGDRPAVWTSGDGNAWLQADAADFSGGGAKVDENLSAILGVDGGLIGVGSAYRADGHSPAVVWVGARSGDLVADHVCPVRIDSLALLASMTGADRSACIGDSPIKVAALARASTNDCGEAEGPADLSQCGGYVELAPLEGGYALLTLPLDPSKVGAFGFEGFTPWTLTLRTGLTPSTCSEPLPGANGVVYEPVESTHLQCRALLRVIGQAPIVHR